MLRKEFNRIRLNFRETKSERAATTSYRGYRNRIKRLITKANIIGRFKKKG